MVCSSAFFETILWDCSGEFLFLLFIFIDTLSSSISSNKCKGAGKIWLSLWLKERTIFSNICYFTNLEHVISDVLLCMCIHLLGCARGVGCPSNYPECFNSRASWCSHCSRDHLRTLFAFEGCCCTSTKRSHFDQSVSNSYHWGLLCGFIAESSVYWQEVYPSSEMPRSATIFRPFFSQWRWCFGDFVTLHFHLNKSDTSGMSFGY